MIVPEKIKRSQVVAACEALGLDPDLVRSFSCNATEKHIRAVMSIPGLPDSVTGMVDIPVVIDELAAVTAETPATDKINAVSGAKAADQ